jgi:uncharacterized membrane protein YidH (DUF202 family)
VLPPGDADDPEDVHPGLARERTRLAWVRTAITFAAAGVAMLRVAAVAGVLVLAGVPVVWLLGHVSGRQARPERQAVRLLLVTVGVVAIATLAVVAAFVGQGPADLRQLLRHG